MTPGWSDGVATTDVSDGYLLFDLTGPAALDVMAMGAEYDFASNLLVTELISQAESKTEFAYNTTLQKLVEEIRLADQRVNLYREDYDGIAEKYNAFLEKNRNYLNEINQDDSLETRPLFQMTYED